MHRTCHSGRRSIASLRRSGGIRLTSMMDILTVLLLFLLKSFVVDGEAMTPRAGIDLPESTAEGSPDPSLVVAIQSDGIVLEDELVASLAEVRDGGLEISALSERLDAVWTRMDALARRRGEREASAPTATIQGDRDLEFDVLQRVMFTLAENGFEDISLAVIKKS